MTAVVKKGTFVVALQELRYGTQPVAHGPIQIHVINAGTKGRVLKVDDFEARIIFVGHASHEYAIAAGSVSAAVAAIPRYANSRPADVREAEREMEAAERENANRCEG